MATNCILAERNENYPREGMVTPSKCLFNGTLVCEDETKIGCDLLKHMKENQGLQEQMERWSKHLKESKKAVSI